MCWHKKRNEPRHLFAHYATLLSSSFCSAPVQKSEAAITQEIQAIIRQITASVTFLPLLNDTCTIDLLAYTDKESEVPFEW